MVSFFKLEEPFRGTPSAGCTLCSDMNITNNSSSMLLILSLGSKKSIRSVKNIFKPYMVSYLPEHQPITVFCWWGVRKSIQTIKIE